MSEESQSWKAYTLQLAEDRFKITFEYNNKQCSYNYIYHVALSWTIVNLCFHFLSVAILTSKSIPVYVESFFSTLAFGWEEITGNYGVGVLN